MFNKLKLFSLKNITQNTFVLYALFFIVVVYFLSFLISGNMLYATILALVGFLTSFFSKNMVVVLGTAFLVTFLLRESGILKGRLTMEGMCGGKGCTEGMENQDDDVKYTTDDDGDTTEKMTEKAEKKDGKKDDKKAEKKDGKKAEKDDKTSPTSAPIKLVLDNNKDSEGSKLEINPKDTDHFKQNLMNETEISEYEKKSDRLILAQEKMLNSMNQYKPLLDTINSISKSMSMFKDEDMLKH